MVDGKDGPAPLLHMINDARGIPRFQNNVEFGETGVVTAIRHVPAASLDARTIGALAPSEVLMSYDEAFWRIHSSLGLTSANPITFERHFGERHLPLVALKP